MVAIRALLASLAARDSAASLIVHATSPGISYAPPNSWSTVNAPGTAGDPQFLLANTDQGVVTFTFLHASTFFEFWGYQRSDGGLYSVTIDGGDAKNIDVYNATSTGNDPPVLLYSAYHLSNQPHTVKMTNLFDTRVGHYGQMNVDHFVLALPTVIQPVFPQDSFLVESSLAFSYHAKLSLGADATVNGGSGNTVQVLLDTGATGDWVVWAGCTESVCTSGHSVYHPSQQHFHNLSIHEYLAYGDGGPANTISMWRVNDTVAFGNVSIPSTPFGASDSLPSQGEGLDGNFGMARAYCGGFLCSSYPGFVETMYESGIIKAPALSFYQLAPGDTVPSGVQSSVAIGGVDRNKYIGSMDWFPLTDDSMWIIPDGLRYVTPGNNLPVVNATDQFTHTSLTLDTGDPGLLGLPTNDWKTLVSLVRAKGPDSNGNYLFPCDATMTLNFQGTQNRNYTFTLVDPTTANGGYCSPAANDAGDTTNWIMGAPFFDHYYTVWYFGDRGAHSTIGFGQKNLGASAASSTPVIGYA